jgi:hypothetical protein
LCYCCHVDVGSDELTLALGQLTQLTFLGIGGGYGEQQLTVSALMQLTGLRHLEVLSVSHSPEVSEEVWRVFWTAVQGQQNVC